VTGGDTNHYTIEDVDFRAPKCIHSSEYSSYLYGEQSKNQRARRKMRT